MSPGVANPNRIDVNNSSYTSSTITVGTSQVEAMVGGTRDPERQLLIIYNASNNNVFYGPTGVTTSTGIPLEKKQEVSIPVGNLGVFLIAGSAGNSVIVQEMA
jgi:hypothetical protein